MAYTVAAKIAAHQGFLDRLAVGSTGTATLKAYAGATLIASLPIDHAASAVSGATGKLTLAPVSGAQTAAASGTITICTLTARDGTILEDAIPVEAGTADVSGKAVFSALAVTSGAAVTLVSASVG